MAKNGEVEFRQTDELDTRTGMQHGNPMDPIPVKRTLQFRQFFDSEWTEWKDIFAAQ